MSRRVHLTLIVPNGVDPSIYPWGVALIRDHVTRRTAGVTVSILDFGIDESISGLFAEFASLSSIPNRLLNAAGRRVFQGNADYSSVFMGTLGWMGTRFITVARHNNLLMRGSSREIAATLPALEQFSRRFLELTDQRIGRSRRDAREADANTALLWGITTYDRTTLNVLALSKHIAAGADAAQPEHVVLGGDFWDFKRAPTAVEAMPWIDAIVVGYGEQAMVDILGTIQAGGSARDVITTGVVTAKRRPGADADAAIYARKRDLPMFSKQPKEWTFNLPETYAHGVAEVYDLVRRDRINPRKYRVLTQRGCSFGGCRFCTQIDKWLHFEFPIQEVVAQLRARLEADQPDGPVAISIDNDEMTETDLIYLIEALDTLPVERWYAWYQVKLFTPAIAKALAGLSHPERALFMMNWETLNPRSLKDMTKGHYPLDGLTSAKAVLDCGGRVSSNYMWHFPRQSSGDVAVEAELLDRSMHLVTHPRFHFHAFPYLANSRDLISSAPDKFDIDVVRYAEPDAWLRDALGVDAKLDTTLWQYEYHERLRAEPDRITARLFHNAIKLSRGRAPRLVKALGWALFLGAGTVLRRRAYVRRALLILQQSFARTRTRSVFRIEGTMLHKDFNVLGRRERWARELTPSELLVLRASYWPIKRSDLPDRVGPSVDSAEVEQIIERHLRLGTLVQHEAKLASVVNDPGFHAAARARRDAEQRHELVFVASR